MKSLERFLRTLGATALAYLVGSGVPFLIGFMVNGFRYNAYSISSYLVIFGLIIASVGGVMIVASYSKFRKKVLRTPVDQDVEKDGKESLNWGYILLIAGIATFITSYYMVVS